MRTTIDIDDDLLAAAREIAQRERVSAGQVVSRLLRAALAGTVTPPHPLQPGATVTSLSLIHISAMCYKIMAHS